MKSKFVVCGEENPRFDGGFGHCPGNMPANSTITASAQAVIEFLTV